MRTYELDECILVTESIRLLEMGENKTHLVRDRVVLEVTSELERFASKEGDEEA